MYKVGFILINTGFTPQSRSGPREAASDKGDLGSGKEVQGRSAAVLSKVYTGCQEAEEKVSRFFFFLKLRCRPL